ncbi:MAG: response regulator [Chitinophagaceae bacterium]
MSNQLLIYLADDHNIVAKGISTIIERIENVEAVKIFQHGEALYDACQVKLPDVVFIDINMPVWDGRKTLVELKKSFPQLRCYILSMNNEKEIIDDCINKGAAGYLNKDCSEDELKEAVQLTSNDFYFSKEVLKAISGYTNASNKLFKLLEPLTEREQEILKLLCEGLSPKEIGEQLFLSPRTVETHKKHIMFKFDVTTIGKLISVTLKNNLIK